MKIKIKPLPKGYSEFLEADDTARLLERVADEVADRAEGLAGTVQGEAVWMRRESDETDRVREAILAMHPSPQGRQVASEALQTALGTHRDG